MQLHEDKVGIGLETGQIVGTLFTPDSRVPGVLFVHGWGGSQQQYLARAREAAALGCVCLTFDLSGHADTQPMFGTVSRETNLKDVLAAYDSLAGQRTVDPSRIAVVGSSYGGYLGAILTSMRPIRWLALRAPALYMDSGWAVPKLQLHKDQDLVAYRRGIVPATENRALKACAGFEGDVLIIESENDTIVPSAVITSYREACLRSRSISYRVLPGADHGLTEASSQALYTELLVGWLKEFALGAPDAPKMAAKHAVPDVRTAPPETPPKAV